MGQAAFSWKQSAWVFKAFTHPMWLSFLEELVVGEGFLCDLAGAAGFNVSTASHQLAVLKRVGLVEDGKRGLKEFCSLRVPNLFRLSPASRMPRGNRPSRKGGAA